MKSYIALATALLIALSLTFYWQRLNTLHDTEIESYKKQVNQLLQEIDSRREFIKGIEQNAAQLESQLSSTRRENNVLAAAIDNLQDQIDPDYESIEKELRQSIEDEYSRRAIQNSPVSSKSELIRELAALDPQEFGSVLALQGQYGEFLASLNLSDDRFDVVVSALSTMMEDQNRERLALLENMQNTALQQSGDSVSFSFDGDFERQMRAIDSEEAQLEALSYTLTNEELSAYQQFLADRAELGMFRSSSATFIGGTDSPVIFSSGAIPLDGDSNIAVEVIDLPQN